jgi:hypothetical protein
VTYKWANWILPALLADPVLAPKVIAVPGHETRGRPPSQFSFFPSGILEHHTACMCRIGHDPQSCLNTIISGHGSTPGPISQLLGTFTKPGTRWTGSNVDPHIIVVADGRANHAGTGEYSWGAPSGNGSSIGIEWCGPVGYWPDEVIDFRARVTAALLRNRRWDVGQVDTHYSYGRPIGRKIDPSGAWLEEQTLGLTQPWARNTWRSRVSRLLAPPPPTIPQPPVQEDDVSTKTILHDVGTNVPHGTVYLCDATTKVWIDNGNVAAQLQYRVMEAMGQVPDYAKPPAPWPAALALSPQVAIDGHRYSVVTNGNANLVASFGPIIGPRPPGVDEYGRPI